MNNLIRLAQTGALVAADLTDIDSMSDEDIRAELRKLISEEEAEQRARALLRDFPPGTLASVFQSVSGEEQPVGDVIDEIVNSAAQQMDMVEFYANIADLAETMFPALASLHLADKGGGRYAPGGPSDFGEEYWNPELQQTRAPMNPNYRAPGTPDVKPESERIVPKPPVQYDDQGNPVQPDRYKDPEALQKEWDPGTPPVLPKEMPDFSSMDGGTLNQSMVAMKGAILQALEKVPRPYMMDMIYRYLQANDPEAAEKFLRDGVDSRSRFGFGKPQMMSRFMKSVTPEDLYMYWNSIVNNKILPWVNPEWVDARYGSGEMGKNISGLYQQWLNEEDLSGVQTNWPEQAPWVEQSQDEVTIPDWWYNVSGGV